MANTGLYITIGIMALLLFIAVGVLIWYIVRNRRKNQTVVTAPMRRIDPSNNVVPIQTLSPANTPSPAPTRPMPTSPSPSPQPTRPMPTVAPSGGNGVPNEVEGYIYQSNIYLNVINFGGTLILSVDKVDAKTNKAIITKWKYNKARGTISPVNYPNFTLGVDNVSIGAEVKLKQMMDGPWRLQSMGVNDRYIIGADNLFLDVAENDPEKNADDVIKLTAGFDGIQRSNVMFHRTLNF